MSTTFDWQNAVPHPSVDRRPDRWQATLAAGSTFDNVAWIDRRWLTGSRPYAPPQGQEPLALHTDWLGPVRLVSQGKGWRQMCEIPFLPDAFGDAALDPGVSRQLDSLLDELLAGPLSGDVGMVSDGWASPSAETITRWLSELGHDAAIDEEENVRLTLKCRGNDGQVQIRRDRSRLRLIMRLGQWNDLSSPARQAMIRLAGEANSRGRLVRLAWIDSDNQSRCEAQVDLSGIPAGEGRNAFWSDVLSASVRGLQLTLRRLGLELGVLADPKNQQVVDRLLAKQKPRRRKPR